MNERLKELEKQSYTEVMHEMGGKYTTFDKEKFAELIIQECAEVANAGIDPEESHLVGDDILKHFGVEE
jgi:hypothetical protein